jgi:hypothetical protein
VVDARAQHRFVNFGFRASALALAFRLRFKGWIEGLEDRMLIFITWLIFTGVVEAAAEGAWPKRCGLVFCGVFPFAPDRDGAFYFSSRTSNMNDCWRRQ